MEEVQILGSMGYNPRASGLEEPGWGLPTSFLLLGRSQGETLRDLRAIKSGGAEAEGTQGPLIDTPCLSPQDISIPWVAPLSCQTQKMSMFIAQKILRLWVFTYGQDEEGTA